MEVKELIKNGYIFLDGAMGTILQEKVLKIGESPEALSITAPQELISIHKAYIDAGAQIISTNTFGANSYKLSNSGYSVKDVIASSIENARIASKGTDTLVALDIGPIGKLIEPNGTMTVDEAYEYYKEMITASNDYDIVYFETMTDLLELKTAILCAKENSDKPIFATMTFEENGRTFTGVSPGAMAVTLSGLGVTAIGVNCSVGPNKLKTIVEEMARYTTLPIIAKPNAGLPDPLTNEYDIMPDEFAEQMKCLAKNGAVILGGCCGTTPKYISALVGADLPAIEDRKACDVCICSGTKVVELNEPHIIGERINPTGKKLFKEALRNKDTDYILSQALSQVADGASVLDINVGLPEIDEKEMMVTVIKAVQSVTDVPLQLDSTDPMVLEAGLRVYNGKPIINSVNGEQKSLDNILPLVKKYGASVVGLTLDEQGIPKTKQKRVEIAERIFSQAEKYGIDKKEIFVDCLTLTVSAEQGQAEETLRAMKELTEKYGVKSVLGVSNISFGLPNRELVNSSFLTLALNNGLTLPIINPTDRLMKGAFRSYKILKGMDENGRAYIEAFGNDIKEEKTDKNTELTLVSAIEQGLKGEAEKITAELLKTLSPMEVVDTMLIPALDKAGETFEKGITFLPQLMGSATAAQKSFNSIKEQMVKMGNTPDMNKKIILATVKGDVHDIGKNIVKVLLENYGFNVIDLGKDVPPQKIVETAEKENVKLIGLSALMTTTLKSMEETIELVHKSVMLKDTLVMVGGAVLTDSYAKKIGADFYCKDAKESADVAKEVL